MSPPKSRCVVLPSCLPPSVAAVSAFQTVNTRMDLRWFPVTVFFSFSLDFV